MEKFINELLSKLSVGSKEFVYVSVTPNVGLEMVQVDPVSKIVKTYGHKPLEYSDSMREIADYEQFKTALQELFSELKISPKCNMILNIPLVHFGKIELPLLLNDDGITEAIVSEVEQAYIFKRCEPVVSWFDGSTGSSSETRTIFYSAVQKTAVDKIKEVLNELGATLVSLEVSLISILRALNFSGSAETQMTDGTAWNLMLVNSNGYSIVAMSGKNIVDYYDEPLALKTYELDEIYQAIDASAQIALMNFPTNYMYIVSETDMVSAEHLASKLQQDGKIDFIENNAFKKKELLPVSLDILPDEVMKISMEAIGIAISKTFPYPVTLDFSGNVKKDIAAVEDETISFQFNGKEVIFKESVLRKAAIVLGAVLLVPSLIVMFTLPNVQKARQKELDDINAKIKNVDAEIKKLTEAASATGAFVVKTEVENVVKNNRAKLLSYSAIGESVPKKLWITYFLSKEDGKIDIKGVSENVEDIYKFFRNMKDYLIDTQLRLHNLEMQSLSIDDAVSGGKVNYNFEITNMDDSDLKPTAKSDKNDGNKAKNKSVDKLEPVNVEE